MMSVLGHYITAESLVRLAGTLLSGAAGVGLMTCSLYGWGRLTRHLAGLPNGTWPVSVAVGLSCIVFLGGLLNLCRLAFPAALGGIVLIGLVLAAHFWRQNRSIFNLWGRGTGWQLALQGTAVLILMGFTIAFELAPTLYNAGDDFQHYFPHAVRMVETGTLYGSPLNGLGGITLGAQALLQSFIIGFFPTRLINGADAVFCFFLCLILPISVTMGRPTLWVAGLVGTLSAFLIDPQYTSVSSLFSMTSLFATLVILDVDPREGGEGAPWRWREAAAPALLYAGVIAMKPTGVVFLALYFGIRALAACLEMPNARASLAKAGWIAAWTLIFLSPWLLLYSPYYLAGLISPLGQPSTPLPEVHASPGIAQLLSAAPTFYGSPRLAYTCIAVGLLSYAAVAVIRGFREPRSRRSWDGLAAASAAGGASYFLWVVIGPYLDESTSMLRYSIPALIGTTSVVVPLWAMLSARGAPAVVILVSVALLVLFSSSTRERVSRLLHEGTALAYLHSWSSAGIARARHVTNVALTDTAAASVQDFQNLIPPGEAVLVWTVTQFLLDYHRNHIIDMNLEGLGKPWARIPAVRYVLWQYEGYAANTPELHQRDIAVGRHTGALAARALDVTDSLEDAVLTSRVLRDKDGIVLFEIGERTPTAPDLGP